MAAKICVIGTWHLGCVVSACLAEMGNDVRGIDFDRRVISNLQKRIPPLFEPGLEDLIKKNMDAGRLSYHFDFKSALHDVDFIFITFDTPVNDKDQSDLSPIYRACDQIAQSSGNPRPYIVVSSQMPVGTCRRLKEYIRKNNRSMVPDIIYNPENLRLGKAISTFMQPDRIVIGAEEKETAVKLVSLYDGIKAEKLVMTLESAEMVKHALNSFLAASISFINEIADLCEVSSADIRDVVRALKSDQRIGQQSFLNPGLGFAGGTLARDLQVLISTGKKNRLRTDMVQSTLNINQKRIESLLKKLKKKFTKLKKLKGGILGLTYKPGTSTLRRSVSLELAGKLVALGINVKAYDPMIPEWPQDKSGGSSWMIPGYKKIRLCRNPYETAEGCQFLLLATEWPEFKELDFSKLSQSMIAAHPGCSKPLFIDSKNALDPAVIVRGGFQYLGTGVSMG